MVLNFIRRVDPKSIPIRKYFSVNKSNKKLKKMQEKRVHYGPRMFGWVRCQSPYLLNSIPFFIYRLFRYMFCRHIKQTCGNRFFLTGYVEHAAMWLRLILRGSETSIKTLLEKCSRRKNKGKSPHIGNFSICRKSRKWEKRKKKLKLTKMLKK